MAKNNIPVSYELAQKFITDLCFLIDYRERNADEYNNPMPTQIYRDAMIKASENLIDTCEEVMDSLYEHSAAEFAGWCSDKPQRSLTAEEKIIAEKYITG